ncbi:hypothetical protein Tco_0112215 [Tanacetum coccineum]
MRRGGGGDGDDDEVVRGVEAWWLARGGGGEEMGRWSAVAAGGGKGKTARGREVIVEGNDRGKASVLVGLNLLSYSSYYKNLVTADKQVEFHLSFSGLCFVSWDLTPAAILYTLSSALSGMIAEGALILSLNSLPYRL